MEIVIAVLLTICGVLILALSCAGWFGELSPRPTAKPPGKQTLSVVTQINCLAAGIERTNRGRG